MIVLSGPAILTFAAATASSRLVGSAAAAGSAFVDVPRSARLAMVLPLPPKGFVWADTSFLSPSKETEAVPETKVAPVVQSWYDSGMRLETPSPPPDDLKLELEGKVVPTRTASSSAAEPPLEVPEMLTINVDELEIMDRLGAGTQSEVLYGELPEPVGPVAVKVGLRINAIAREAAVLSVVSGFPGFPTMLHCEGPGPLAAGGFLLVRLLGSSLDDLWKSPSYGEGGTAQGLSGPTFLRVGRGVVRCLRQLHLAGYVHNDVKPANLLLGPGSAMQPTTLHLIDFGSCTRAEPDICNPDAVVKHPFVQPPQGAIGTQSFASAAADEWDPDSHLMRPADDLESLAYTLAYLARGSLPWQGKNGTEALVMKRDLLTSDSGAVDLTEGIECSSATRALQALWKEVQHYYSDDRELCITANAAVDYEACMTALGGGPLEIAEAADDEISEFSMLASMGKVPASEVEAEQAAANTVLEMSL